MTTQNGGGGRDFAPEPGGAPRKKRKTPWVRRIVSTLILLLVLALLLWGLVKIGGWVKTILTDEHERATQGAVIEPAVIEPCSSDALRVTVTPVLTAVQEGEGFDVSVAVENVGASDCSFSLSTLEITLGSENGLLWTPSACTSSWDKELLLGAGKSWSTSLAWDGHVYADCELVKVDGFGATPMEGTYTLKWQAPPVLNAQETQIRIY